ncbi:HCL625Cp [Eremothecium sinecaudum]|uniref:HCL625Cp n=1 Tax=Eremothecium sinecaudum TaxID=45286 RepID=A0A109UXT7_9SACH|nr:HCL625Cp [Eremothecium sinecaudum]AMD19526.1 HCL625Cp [Eremothecium sinecaudum]
MDIDWSDDDCDDDILELANRPPRATQLSNVPTRSDVYTQQLQLSTTANVAGPTYNSAAQLENELMAARGEAGMLRDKLLLLEKDREKERERLQKKEKDLESVHQQEINKLREELQRLEDERKFLMLEKRQLAKFQANTSPVQLAAPNQAPGDSVKKRKVDNVITREFVPLNPNRTIPDESSLFVDALVLNKLHGCSMSLLDILDHICLENTDGIGDILPLATRAPLGKPIRMMLFKMKGTMQLDMLVDSCLEKLAVLIRGITLKNDCKFAVPFLVACMYQMIQFRPSAIHINALKDTFQFISDLAITYQHLLKKPLHESPLKLDVKPNIFQYEFIDILAMLYCFDIMELCIKLLLLQSPEEQLQFFDKRIWDNVTKIIHLSLSMSYKSIFNVVYNTVEIIHGLAQVSLPQEFASSQWWDSILARLFHVWARRVNDKNIEDNDNIHLPLEYNISGMIRCLGDNANIKLLEQLVDSKGVNSIPEVVHKQFPKMSRSCKLRVEEWGLNLQLTIAAILEKVLTKHPSMLPHSSVLSHTIKLLCKEQEFMLVQCLGSDSENAGMRITLIEELVRLIYHTWTQVEEPTTLIKDLQNDLTICLWRIVFGNATGAKEVAELQESSLLIDAMHNLKVQEQIDYYEDALDAAHIPSFLSEELQRDKTVHCVAQLNAGCSYNCREQAKFVLERITSPEDADALYLSMVAE